MAHTGLLDALFDTLFDSKLALGTACAGAVAIGVLAVVGWSRPDVAREAAPAPARSWEAPLGPGLLAGPVRDLPTPGLDAQVIRDVKIALDGAGHLAPDAALRNLMDAFLVRSERSERQAMVAQLRALLQSRLRAPAAGEADRLVTDYLAYLSIEERMRERERFARSDPSGLSDQEIEHLLAWQQQRAQLRQRMLGSAVARAWFEEEDGRCIVVLEEWRKQRAPQGADEEADSGELMLRRRQGTVLEERRNNNAQACAAKIADTMAP